jgi:hypothetical protein
MFWLSGSTPHCSLLKAVRPKQPNSVLLFLLLRYVLETSFSVLVFLSFPLFVLYPLHSLPSFVNSSQAALNKILSLSSALLLLNCFLYFFYLAVGGVFSTLPASAAMRHKIRLSAS